MAEKDKITEGAVTHEGLFNFKDSYNFLYKWFVDYEYFIEEKKYSEKIKGEGKDIEIEWEASRKISDYFKFVLKIRWEIFGLTKEKVNGKTFDKGSVKIKITGFIIKDWENKWASSAFSKFLRDIYDHYIIKARIKTYEDRICEEVDEALAQVKSFLALEGRKEA